MSAGLLSRVEILVYFVVYIVYICFGLYKIYGLRDRILRSAEFQFAEGWRLLQTGDETHVRDDSNDELQSFNEFISKFWPFYLLHVLITSILNWKWPKFYRHGYAAVCALALVLNLHWASLSTFAVLIASYYLIRQLQSKCLVWLLSGFWLAAIHTVKNSEWFLNQVEFEEYITLIVTLSWSVLRGVSYALTKDDSRLGSSTAADYLGYIMYFPSLVNGPFISYERFLQQPQAKSLPLVQHWRTFLVDLMRVGFWWLVMQLALHYFYIHYMSRDVRAVAMMGSVFWQHSVGYFIGQMFFVFYVVSYGLGIAFAEFDGIPAPRRPCCIGRIHFYSDMWKHFDQGLYEFLFKHIYCELCSRQSSLVAKLSATATTFVFVFIWHGCSTYILIWSALNFLCLVAEKLYFTLISLTTYQKWTLQLFGPAGMQRLNGLLATQLFIPAVFANVYFIAGEETGIFLMRGAFLSGMGNYLALCFCSYCFFHCSEFLRPKANLGNQKDKIKAL